jgi:hypothetical protein
VISGDIWEFLKDKYSFDHEVRRYFYKSQFAYQSQMEVRMKRVPIVLVFVEKLPGKQFTQANLKTVFVQIRNSHTYSDLKKRICDCVN